MVDHVLIPQGDKWKRVQEPRDIFKHILERNKHQLLKSTETPFASGPLSKKIGRDGGGDFTEDILNGTVDTSFIQDIDPSEEMSHFIQALQRPLNKDTGHQIPELKYTMDTETYNAIFSKANEATSSSPSGIHYGHYIVALQDDLLREVNTIFMRVPFKFGFPLERWSSSVHCMLQKKNNPT